MLSVLLFAQLAAVSPLPTRFELSNGLRVWVQEDHSRPIALVHITYHAGSLNEGPGQTGVAHYVEHMVYRATEGIRNEDVYGYIDRIGGRYTGGTWPEVTRYAETVPSWALEPALRVTAERMTRAIFDSLEFERERSNVVTEAHGFADLDPTNALRDAVMMAAFEVHPYRYSSNTWARDNLTLTRAQAYAWYREHYGPNNAVLVVAGDVRTDEVRRLVETHFAPLARAPGNGRIDVVEPAQRAEKRVTLTEPSDSARLEIVYHAPSAHDRSFPAYARAAQIFSAGVRKRVASVDTSIRVEIRDSATAYPHVYRISVSAAPTVSMASVLEAIDANLTDPRGARPMVAALEEQTTNVDSVEIRSAGAVPPRRSTLTRTAEALASRETPSWEVSSELRDSLRLETARSLTAQPLRFDSEWSKRSNRTVGILQPRGPKPDTARYAMDIPAMTTPPARRERPDPVPPRALEPLAPINIERAARTLSNGIRVRAALAEGSTLHLRAILDQGDGLDTLAWTFPVASADSALHGALDEIRIRLARRPAPRSDSNSAARARGRVVGSVLPPVANDAAARAPLTIAIVGPQAPAHMLAMVARHVDGFSARRRPRSRNAVALAGAGDNFVRAMDRQVEIVAGLPGVHRDHRDRRAIELLNYIVGVPYYGGRLGWALTKTGLTYSSAAQSYSGETGYILLSTTADTRNTPAVIQAIREIVAGVGERGVEEWELREAKAFMLGRALLYGAREDSPPATIAAALTDSDAAALDLLDLPALSRAYLSVTLADINRVARAYYRPDRLTVVAIGAVPSADMKSPFAAGTFRALFEPR